MAADMGRDVRDLDSVNLIVAFDHMVEAVLSVHCNLGQPLLVQKQEATVAWILKKGHALPQNIPIMRHNSAHGENVMTWCRGRRKVFLSLKFLLSCGM